MKVSVFSTVLSAALLGAVAQATTGHELGAGAGHHHQLARRHGAAARGEHTNRLGRRKGNGRCKPRPTSSLATVVAPQTTKASSTAAPATTSSSVAPATTSSSAAPAYATPTANAAAAAVPSSGSGGSVSTNSGVINVQSSCGATGATVDITATSGPNGNEDWMNCGLYDAGGWNPPYVTLADIKTVDLSEAVTKDDSPFKQCTAYIDKFVYYAKQNNLPPIILASIAMQESSCNPNTVGGGGEQGLMQLNKEKCLAAPGGNCQDVDYNISTGAAFFAQSLKDHGGDLLCTIGGYNGWFRGMTFDDATKAARGNCCRCQNNLDYLQQFLNGWCMNFDAYDSTPRLGYHFNLDVCPHE